MKLFFQFCIFICVMIIYDSVSIAQTYTGDLWITTQSEIDNFSYTAITGELWITESTPGNITSLDGLSELTYLGTRLNIYNNISLTNLNGLSNLTIIGGAGYGGCVYIDSNPVLINLDGLLGISLVPEFLVIQNCQSLSNINGLSNISSVGTFLWIQYNSDLLNVDGLSNLTSIGELMRIRFNGITNLDGLSNLNSVGGNVIINLNDNLIQLDGLSNLTYVGGELQILANTSLTQFCGLYNLLFNNGLIGNYNVLGNGYNPSIQDILNAGPCEYNIEEGFDDLVLEINELPISNGDKTALTQKLVQAESKYNDGKYRPALNLLNAFINNVNLLIAENVLTQTEGDILIGYANDLIDAINSILPKGSEEVSNSSLVISFSLSQNYPNPFNPSTVIKYQIASNDLVTLKVYNTLGKEISELVNEIQAEGTYEVEFNASSLPSGVYFYTLRAGSYIETKKMILMK